MYEPNEGARGKMRMKDGSKRNSRIRREGWPTERGKGTAPQDSSGRLKIKKRQPHAETPMPRPKGQKAHTGHKSPVPKTKKQVVPTWTDTHARRLGLETHRISRCVSCDSSNCFCVWILIIFHCLASDGSPVLPFPHLFLPPAAAGKKTTHR